MDEMAHRLGMDPLEFRRKNDTHPFRKTYYEVGAKAIGWERRNRKPGDGLGKQRRGLGIASQIWWGGGVPGTLADIKLHRDGSVEAVSGTQDIGCGTRTYMATIAAETLGLEPQDITIKIGDTVYPSLRYLQTEPFPLVPAT